jgi:L-ascorbate metabolism protein UlaG (beta-lactamase superfamily)
VSAEPITVLLFAGAARTPLIDGPLTLTSEEAAEAARILQARHVVPAHTEGWEHVTEGPGMVEEAFARSGLRDRLVAPAPGDGVTLCGGDGPGSTEGQMP